MSVMDSSIERLVHQPRGLIEAARSMTHTERLINESRRSVAKCYATLLEVEAIHQNLSSACHEENQATGWEIGCRRQHLYRHVDTQWISQHVDAWQYNVPHMIKSRRPRE